MKYILIITLLFIGCKDGYGQENVTVTFKPPQDTVKVLMLVCDTSLNQKNGIIIWQRGYEISGEITAFAFGEKFTLGTEVIQYLYENKKPLPPTTVVWQTLKIKTNE